ncbi:MAG: hypothetical protein WAO00_07345 [Chthoniobacterales bacterium]
MHKPLTPWTDLPARKDACLTILKRAISDSEFRRQCLSSAEYARQAFIDIGGMDVPGDVKISFVPEGDLENAEQNQSGSLVLEVPPRDATTDPELIDYVRCTYPQWIIDIQA